MQPLLPCKEKIYPYLAKIDQTRFYSNGGALSKLLTSRLASILSIQPQEVVLANNSTIGMTNCIRLVADHTKPYCVVPSWTFPAVPASVISAGFEPYFVDVDLKTGSISPEIIKNSFSSFDKIAAVIAVDNFGVEMNVKEWEEFRKQTGVAVVIDAAAAFDTIANKQIQTSYDIPISVSLHATKSLGIGEGGMVICRNEDVIQTLKYMGNFGFTKDRDVILSGTNAKLSEYTAAVGLAAVDEWKEKQHNWQRRTNYYIDALEKIGIKAFLSKEYVIPTCSVILEQKYASKIHEIISLFIERGIEVRQFWQNGCHTKTAYKKYPSTMLPNTEQLVSTVLTLPFYVDMEETLIDEIVGQLLEILLQVSQDEVLEVL